MICQYRYCNKEITYGRPDRRYCNKNCKLKEVNIVKQLKILDRKSKKTREFILRSKLIHGDKYIYDLVVYDNCRTKVKIVCPIHGEFEQTPDGHLYKSYGCEKCSREARRVNRES